MTTFKRSRRNNMSPTKEIEKVTLPRKEIEEKINEKLDEGLSKLQTAKNYMLMLEDYESVQKLEEIILELDNFN